MTKTTKLCVIDLEWIAESACGEEAPESLTDQALLPCVKDAIDRYRADGWHLAIVAKIPDCTCKFKASDVRVGDYVIRGSDCYQVEAIDTRIRGEIVFKYDKYLKTGTPHEWLKLNDEVLYSGFSPKHMINLVTSSADFYGVEEAYFCLDTAGKVIYCLGKSVEYGWRSMTVSDQEFESVTLPKTRIPSYAKSARIFPVNKCLMVGGSDSKQVAIDAGFEFMSAHEFCKSGAA